jgi:hypothetical protein
MGGLYIKFLIGFLAGSILLLLISFTIYRKSYYYQKARAEAEGKEGPTGKSLLVTLFILLVMVLALVGFDCWILSAGTRSFPFLVLLNLGLITSLSLFDALFIDLFILLIWRPNLLNLPEGQPTREHMNRHIMFQFTRGWIFKIPIALLGAGIGLLLG